MVSPYLCTDSHREDTSLLVPVYSAETRPIGEIGCDECISSLETVDIFLSDGPMPIVSHGKSFNPPLDEELWFKDLLPICDFPTQAETLR